MWSRLDSTHRLIRSRSSRSSRPLRWQKRCAAWSRDPVNTARSGPWVALMPRSSCSMSEFESHVRSYKDSKEEMVEVLSQDLFPWQDMDAFLDAIENEDWEISCYELRACCGSSNTFVTARAATQTEAWS